MVKLLLYQLSLVVVKLNPEKNNVISLGDMYVLIKRESNTKTNE